MKTKASNQQLIVSFFNSRISFKGPTPYRGDVVYITCAPLHGSISRQKKQAERNCGDKLHTIAFCSVKSKAEFCRFLKSAKHLKTKGNWYRVEGVVWDALVSLERRADQAHEEFLAAA